MRVSAGAGLQAPGQLNGASVLDHREWLAADSPLRLRSVSGITHQSNTLDGPSTQPKSCGLPLRV